MYIHKNIDVIHYLGKTEVEHINSMVSTKAKIKIKDVVIPTANKKGK
jgi:hypothetical protein